MAEDRVRRHGEKLLLHRERTVFGEIDLLFEASDGLKLIEVKTWSHEIWGSSLIPKRQIQRLLKARQWCEDHYQKPTELILAVVGYETATGSPARPNYFVAGSDWFWTHY